MDDQALEFFAWGARSWVCGGSNFLPAEHIALYRPARSRAISTKGRRIMSAMMPLMRVLEQGGKFIQCIKHGCEMMGQLRRPAAPAAERPEQGRQAPAGTDRARPENHHRPDRSGVSPCPF
jgi:4-hydroxy-tetrahydrodipicolinate synthase